jgi:hypothetical protein
MVTITAREEVEQALADPDLVPPPAPDGGAEGSMAWLRATVARFAHGETHARRRGYVEAELARIDVDGLRRLAAGTTTGTTGVTGVASVGGAAPGPQSADDDRIRILRALARAMNLPELPDTALMRC